MRARSRTAASATASRPRRRESLEREIRSLFAKYSRRITNATRVTYKYVAVERSTTFTSLTSLDATRSASGLNIVRTTTFLDARVASPRRFLVVLHLRGLRDGRAVHAQSVQARVLGVSVVAPHLEPHVIHRARARRVKRERLRGAAREL